MRQDRRAARAPPGPQHINFWGCERATPARSASGKGLPSPDGFDSFRGARRSTRARDQAWGPNERRGTAGVNNKARSAAASDGAFGVCGWAGAMSSNRRCEPTDVRGPSHMILIDAPWPQFWFNCPGMHNLGCTKSASTSRSAH